MGQSHISEHRHPTENKTKRPRDTRPRAHPHAILIAGMEHTADSPPLTTVQQCVVNALAAGSTTFVAPASADAILAAMRRTPEGRDAVIIGEAVDAHPGMV